MTKEAILIVNTRSRQSLTLLDEAIVLLHTQGIQLVAIHRITSKKSIKRAITQTLVSSCELVILASGDGTISSLIDHFAYTNKTIAFLPFGTTNNFARTLEIPFTLPEAVDVITSGKKISIDLGKVNNDYFANVVTIGLSGALAEDVSHNLKYYLGRVAYLLTGIKTLFKHRAFNCHIRSDNFQETFHTHQIIIANGRFHAGLPVDPAAKINNQQFILFTLGGFSRLEFIQTSLAYFFGTYARSKSVLYKQVQEFTITLDSPQHIEIDGEASKVTQAHFSIASKAVKVIVSKNFTGSIS